MRVTARRTLTSARTLFLFSHAAATPQLSSILLLFRSAVAAAAAPPLLEVRGLEASIAATGQQILKGVNLILQAGEVRKEDER